MHHQNDRDEDENHCCGGQLFWSKENRIALMEKKEKMLEAKLEFIRKIKENMKKEMVEKKEDNLPIQ